MQSALVILEGPYIEDLIRPQGVPKAELCPMCHGVAELVEVVLEENTAVYECCDQDCLHVQRRRIF